MRAALILSGLALLASGCGEFRERFGRMEHGQATVRFAPSGGGELNAMILGGRILVYMVSEDGSFATNIELNDEYDADHSLTVPSGRYKVIAVGWTGPYPVEGQGYCGFGGGGGTVELHGGSVTIPITMSTGACNFSNSSVFSDAGHTGASDFTTFSVNFCDGILGNICDTSDNSFGGKYLKMNFDIYRREGGGYQKLGEFNFGCSFINMNNAASSKKVPLGNSTGSFPKIFAMSFSVHSDSYCTSAPMANFAARQGIRNGATSGAIASSSETSGSSSYFYVDLL